MASAVRGAGDLRERVHFQSRPMVSDGFNMVPAGPFETQFTVWANFLPLRGSEVVQAARLNGRQPYVITVRSSTDTRRATEAWRIVDARNEGRVFAITAPPTDPDGKRAWLQFLATEGGVS